MKKLIFLYAILHLALAVTGFLIMTVLFFISLRTDGSVMAEIAAGALFVNALFFAALAYAIKN